MDPGAVPRLAAGDEFDPDQRLLTGLQQVGAFTAESDRIPADLADRFGRAVEQMRVLVHEIMRAEHASRFLVGEEGDHEVTFGSAIGADHVVQGSQDHGVHVFHVDRATTPQQAVLDDAGEGVDAPIGRISRHDIQMTVHDEGVLGSITPLHPGHDARAARL